MLKKNKEIGNKQITADSSGHPIYIKGLTSEKLYNDFLFSKSIIHDKYVPFADDKSKQILLGDKEEKKKRNKEISNNSLINTNIIKIAPSVTSIEAPVNKEVKQIKSVKLTSIDKTLDNKSDHRLNTHTNNSNSQITYSQPMGSNFE